MKVIVRGKNKFEPGSKITEYASEKLQKLNQYFRDHEEVEANVLCKAYTEYKTVEVTIPTSFTFSLSLAPIISSWLPTIDNTVLGLIASICLL